jgi:hypothetical protein
MSEKRGYGTAEKLVDYINRNPDDFLTIEDACVKFGVSQNAIYEAIRAKNLELIRVIVKKV